MTCKRKHRQIRGNPGFYKLAEDLLGYLPLTLASERTNPLCDFWNPFGRGRHLGTSKTKGRVEKIGKIQSKTGAVDATNNPAKRGNVPRLHAERETRSPSWARRASVLHRRAPSPSARQSRHDAKRSDLKEWGRSLYLAPAGSSHPNTQPGMARRARPPQYQAPKSRHSEGAGQPSRHV